MPDIFVINRTSKIKWLKKLFLLRESNKYRIFAWHLLNIKMSEFKNKLSVEYKDKCLTLLINKFLTLGNISIRSHHTQ